MRCTHVQGLFSEIYDGIVEEQSALVRHLHECPVCAAEYEDFGKLINELRQLPMPELPEDFHETIMAKVREIASSGDGEPEGPELRVHSGRQPIKLRNQKRPIVKAHTAIRRWAGVAAAACVLLVSLWAMRVLDLPMRQNDSFFIPLAPISTPVTDGIDIYVLPASDETIEFEPDADEGIPPAISARIYAQEYSVDYDLGDTMGGYSDMDAAWEIFSDETDADFEWSELSADFESITPIMQMAADLPQDFLLEGTPVVDERLILSPRGSAVWTVALVIGLTALCISLGAIFWNVRSEKKAKKG